MSKKLGLLVLALAVGVPFAAAYAGKDSDTKSDPFSATRIKVLNTLPRATDTQYFRLLEKAASA